MPSLNKIKKPKGSQQAMTRPFTIFYVNAKTPKEVLTDTIMAQNCKEAQALAATKHMTTSILYVRGIGDTVPPCNNRKLSTAKRLNYAHFPCARYIKGQFLQASFTDDSILESLSDPV